jgi:hypothetical protein
MLELYASTTHRHPIDASGQRRNTAHYELRFTGLFNVGRGLAFPCDAQGNVDLDSLTDRARLNYFYARTTIGRDFFSPVTCQVDRRNDC